EVEPRVESGPERSLIGHDRGYVGQRNADVPHAYGLWRGCIGFQRPGQSLAVERLDQELPVAFDGRDLIPLDLEIGTRISVFERQHVFVQLLDLADKPLAG